jgi:hypothetical protein
MPNFEMVYLAIYIYIYIYKKHVVDYLELLYVKLFILLI